jgi:PmbA protein
VRDGAVEESERSEGDDVGLRVLVGRRQAVVSTNDVSGDGVAALAERAVAMARVAPDDKYVGLADPALLARDFPISICSIRKCPVDSLNAAPARPKPPGLAVKGVTKSGGASASAGIGGMVLVTSTGFHGSYLRSSQGISMTAIAGDGTGMERDYDYHLRRRMRPIWRRPESVGRTAGERTVARANPRKVETCKVPVVFDPRVSGSLVGHLVGAVNGASIARKTSFLKDRLGEQFFAKNIRIIDDPLAGARIALAVVRRRGRQGQEARHHR